MNELLTSIRKNAIGLGLFALVTAGAIAVTQVTTAERIQENRRHAQARALNEILPSSRYDNDLLSDTLRIDSRFNQQLLGPLPEDAFVHLAKKDGKTVALILPVIAPDGYTTAIQLLVGIYSDGSVAGVRVVDHRETPGLGDKIDIKKSDWIKSFADKSLVSPSTDQWKVKKDGGAFDQFTGATITPRAVVKAVKHALTFFDMHKNILLNPTTPSKGA